MADGLTRLVEVMDTLRSPGGCPWDAEQTHESLVRYAIEEVYELADAIETGTRTDLREELGDVLLQVVFHARMAEDHPTDPFALDDVAHLCADKLVERHPHVFADADGTVTPAGTMSDLHARWDKIKAETTQRESVFDGIPVAQPALARAQKVLNRVQRTGLQVQDQAGVDIGTQLFALVARAQAEGVDAETALRDATRAYETAAREVESARSAEPNR